MRSWGAFLLLVLSVGVAGCGDDDNPTSPTTQPLVFTAQLSPASENPPVSNAESSGRGAAQISFVVARDSSNAITGGTATFYFQVSGFPGGTRVVGAHIHIGGPSVNGPIVVDTRVSAATPVATDGGTGEFSASGIAVNAATMQGIVNNPEAYYFNVHSPLNPGGFARGQLSRIQ
jgi:hypothetical protein